MIAYLLAGFGLVSALFGLLVGYRWGYRDGLEKAISVVKDDAEKVRILEVEGG